MKNVFSWTLALCLMFGSGSLLALTAHPYASSAVLEKDTAMANGKDEVILQVLLMDEDFGPIAHQTVYCATTQEQDDIVIGPNVEGHIQVRIRSSLPGSRKLAISLESKEAAVAFLEGEKASAAQIIPIDRLTILGTVHFIAGDLTAENSYLEFTKTTEEILNEQGANPLQGKIILRTEFNHPVTDQLVLFESNLPGVTITPASLITDHNGTGSFQVTSSTVGEAKIYARIQEMRLEHSVFFEPPGSSDDGNVGLGDEEGADFIDVKQSRVLFRSYWGLTGEEGIFISGIILNHQGEPVEGEAQLYAFSTFGEIDRALSIPTQQDGSFSFRLRSATPGQGTIVIGLAKPDVLERHLKEPSETNESLILTQQGIAFFEHSPLAYLWCSIGHEKAVDSNQPILLEVAPFLHQNRTMMALRPLANMLGAQLLWQEADREVIMVYEEVRLKMGVGVPILEKETPEGTTKIALDTAPLIRNGRTVFPLRHIGEAFGLKVNYDAKDRSITVVKEMG